MGMVTMDRWCTADKYISLRLIISFCLFVLIALRVFVCSSTLPLPLYVNIHRSPSNTKNRFAYSRCIILGNTLMLWNPTSVIWIVRLLLVALIFLSNVQIYAVHDPIILHLYLDPQLFVSISHVLYMNPIVIQSFSWGTSELLPGCHSELNYRQLKRTSLSICISPSSSSWTSIPYPTTTQAQLNSTKQQDNCTTT